MCKDCNLIDKTLTSTDIDLLFTRNKIKNEKRCNYEGFEAIIEGIALKKKKEPRYHIQI